jgi:hypothetical protein
MRNKAGSNLVLRYLSNESNTSTSLRNAADQVDRLVLKTMAVEAPKAQISSGKAAISSQRVEDNAFHRLHPP